MIKVRGTLIILIVGVLFIWKSQDWRLPPLPEPLHPILLPPAWWDVTSILAAIKTAVEDAEPLNSAVEDTTPVTVTVTMNPYLPSCTCSGGDTITVEQPK